MKRIVVISDVQYPYHSKKALASILRFIKNYNPDEVVQIGDLMDYPQVSRFSKATAAEFEGSVIRDSQRAVRDFIEPLRKVYNGPIGVIEGNHDLRPRAYLEKYAPALHPIDAFNVEQLLRFDDHGIRLLPDFYNIAPGWVATHGHLGGIRLSQICGATSLNAAMRMGVSVVMGHTHRLGLLSYSYGYDQTVTQHRTGFEVGHLMDMKQAHYLKQAAGNWQMGFGILYVDGKHVQATPVPITNKFVVEGEVYKL